MRWIVGDADELRSGDFSRGLGATNGNENCSLKNWKNEKKEAVLNSVKLVKRKIRIDYNNFML